MGLAETRHCGRESGKDLGGGFVLMYSGSENRGNQHGVAMILGPRISQYIQEVQLINERLMKCTLRIKNRLYHIFQIYAPQSGKTREEKEAFMDLLDDCYIIGEDDVGLLMGDFNARVGKERTNVEGTVGPFGEEVKNEEGEALIDFCVRNDLKIMNGFFYHRESHKFTRYRWNRNLVMFDQKSIIDYFIISDKRLVDNVKVLPGISFNADHRLVLLDWKVKGSKSHQPIKRKIFRTKALKIPGKREEYEEKMNSRISQREGGVIQWEEVKRNIEEVAREVLGEEWVGGSRKRHTPWWNDEVRDAIKEKTKLMRRWMKNRTAITREEYVEARRNAERVKKRAEENSWISLGERLRVDLTRGKTLLYGLVKAYGKSKTRLANIKDENGNILTEPRDINERWTRYFEDLLNVDPEREEEMGEGDIGGDEQDFTMMELEAALKKMKNGKSPGEDNLAIELLKEGGNQLIEQVLEVINGCWREGEVPAEWGKSIIVPIYKKKGDSGQCNNYRGISLMDHIAKLYERMIECRLREIVEQSLGEEQHGYRKGRGTTDLIFSLRQVVEKAYEYNVDLFIVFIDLQKAFDSVPRGRLWTCIETEYRVGGRLMRAMKSLYKTSKCNVRTGFKNNEWFDVRTGVRQGSVLSPLLFIAYLDKVMVNFNERWNRRSDGGVLAYADDIACWSVNREELERSVGVWRDCFEEAGMRINASKTVFLRVGRRGGEELEVELDGVRLENVQSFNYLGSKFTGTGVMEDISERIQKYNKVTQTLFPIIKNKNVPLEAKRTIFETVMTPVLMYGSECWATTTKTRSRIQAAEMKPLRTMIGKTRRDKIRNERVRAEVGVCKIINKIEAGQLRWLGHLERMPEERLAKRSYVWDPGGRRPPGRPRKRWIDGARETLERHGMDSLETLREDEIFADRMEWRRRLAPLTGV